MIAHELSRLANTAAARYEKLTTLWRALYERALSRYEGSPADTIEWLGREAYNEAHAFLEDEQGVIIDTLEKVAGSARERILTQLVSIDTEELNEQALAHLSATQVYLYDEILAQIRRDVAHVRQEFQRAILEITMLTRTRGLSVRAAIIEWRMTNPDSLNFAFRDRKFRNVDSAIYIRSLWRLTLLSTYNEVVMLTLADHGVPRAGVMRLDENNSVRQVEVITLDGQGVYETYADIRGRFFHPNANAWLDVEVTDV